jgi:hypothetical protein
MRKARIAVVTVLPRRYRLARLALPLWLAVGSLDVAWARADAAIADTNATKRGQGCLAVFMLVAVLWMWFVQFRLRHLSATARFLAFEGRKRWLAR